jgi:hypothetical protein
MLSYPSSAPAAASRASRQPLNYPIGAAGGNNPARSVVSVSVRQAIEQLAIPVSVQNKSLEIYSMLKDEDDDRRQTGRLKILCYCVNQAYVELELSEPSLARLALLLGINKAQAAAAIKTRPAFVDGFRPKTATRDPVKLVASHAKETLHLSDYYITDMTRTIEQLIELRPSLLMEHANPLVAAFFICYAENNAMELDLNYLTESFGLELSTIRSRCTKIRSAYISLSTAGTSAAAVSVMG